MTTCIRCEGTLLPSDPRERTWDPATWYDHLDWPADGHAPETDETDD